MSAALVLALALPLQGLSDRVAAAPDGEVRFTYATRAGVCGNGRGVISLECEDGRCGRHRISSGNDYDDDAACPCEAGPARVALRKRGGQVTRLRVYVGGAWPPAAGAATDLGVVPAQAASRFLLDLAARAPDGAGHDAVLPAILADSVTVWPDLLRLARTATVAHATRRSAVFWLGQAAGDAATRGLTELLNDDAVDRDVKESAVFALSQRPREEGVPALIRIARTHRDPDVRRKAIFWLGQSDDPRALALFEELLTKER
ncbi:MAG TPA: HEAT repeat domain-containing protein [Gemmatimonadales bacterium]|nr:HEAT repeat domain-containing protein [Gemmatimonadales bacterium]